MCLKNGKLSKNNYRPLSILPNLSKIFQGSMYHHILITWLSFYQNFSSVLEKGVTHTFYQNNLQNFSKRM